MPMCSENQPQDLPPGRAYTEALPTPIFRGVGINKVGGHQAAVLMLFLLFLFFVVSLRQGSKPTRARTGHAGPGLREPSPPEAGSGNALVCAGFPLLASTSF